MSDRPRDGRRAHLRLVPDVVPSEAPAAGADLELDDPSDEELRAAEALRDALDAEREGPAAADSAARPALAEEGRAGLRAIRAAFSPATLSHEDHERLLERVLAGDERAAPAPLPPASLVPEPSRAEERTAAALRGRVDAGLRPDPDAEPDDEIERLVDVAIALRSAHAPHAVDALAEARIRKGALASPRSRRRTIATTIAALAVAAAAAFAVIPRVAPGSSSTAALVPARSTQELFDPAEPFPREGGASARIDRISTSRSADLRQNRFARWGVK